MFWLCFVLARLLRRGHTPVATIQGFAGAYGNIGYLGPPLAISAFGPEAGVPVALIFCLDNSMHFVQAPLLMAIGSKQRRALLPLIGGIPRQASSAIRSFWPRWPACWRPCWSSGHLNPSTGCCRPWPVPPLPALCFAMGVTAALKPLKRIPLELTWLVPIKLLLHPLLMYLLVSRLPGVPDTWLHVAVLMAALPSATNVFRAGPAIRSLGRTSLGDGRHHDDGQHRYRDRLSLSGSTGCHLT